MYHDRSNVVSISILNVDSTRLLQNQSTVQLLVGHVIVITGIPYGNPKGWFLLKFNEAASKRQALHLSVRFDPHFVVVRNHMNERGE